MAQAQFVHHAADAATQGVLDGGIVSTGKGKGQGGHVVPRAVSLQFGGGRVPSVGAGISLSGQAVGIAVVVELLADVPAEYGAYGQVAVAGQAVVPLHRHLVEWKRFGHRLLCRSLVVPFHHVDGGFDGIALRSSEVSQYETFYLVAPSRRVD